MKKKHNVYVDDSCLYVEGQVASALASGIAMNDSEARSFEKRDLQFAIDFKALFARLDARVGRAWLFGSTTTVNGSIWRHASAAGFELRTTERALGRREKGVDAEMLLTISETTSDFGPGDVVTLVTGDGDFTPVVKRLVARGIFVRVVFWRHATSATLISTASAFSGLDVGINALRLRRRVA